MSWGIYGINRERNLFAHVRTVCAVKIYQAPVIILVPKELFSPPQLDPVSGYLGVVDVAGYLWHKQRAKSIQSLKCVCFWNLAYSHDSNSPGLLCHMNVAQLTSDWLWFFRAATSTTDLLLLLCQVTKRQLRQCIPSPMWKAHGGLKIYYGRFNSPISTGWHRWDHFTKHRQRQDCDGWTEKTTALDDTAALRDGHDRNGWTENTTVSSDIMTLSDGQDRLTTLRHSGTGVLSITDTQTHTHRTAHRTGH